MQIFAHGKTEQSLHGLRYFDTFEIDDFMLELSCAVFLYQVVNKFVFA